MCVGKNRINLDSQVKHQVIVQMALGYGKNYKWLRMPLRNSQIDHKLF